MNKTNHPPEIKALMDQVVLHQFTDFSKVTSACQELLRLSAISQNIYVESYAYYYLAEMHFNKNEFPEAISNIFKGLYNQQENNYSFLEINSYNLLGNIFRIQQNEQLSLDFYLKGLNRAKEEKIKLLEAITSTNIADLYYNLEDYNTATSYFEKGVHFYELEVLNPDSKVDYTIPLAASYINLGLSSLRLENIEKLLFCINKLKSLDLSKLTNTFLQLLAFLCSAYEYTQGNEKACLYYIKEFLSYYDKKTNIVETFQEYIDSFYFAMSFNSLEYASDIFKIIHDIAFNSEDSDVLIKYYDVQIQYYEWTNKQEELSMAYKNYYKIQKQYGSTVKAERLNAINLQFSLNSILEDQKKNAENLETLKVKSEHDALTNLPNRYLLREYCEEQFKLAMVNEYNFGVAILDMDSFKEYNDYWGHLEGDSCITKISNLIKKLSTSYFCARYGGDEFIFIFVNKRSTQIRAVIEELNRQIQELEIEHAPSVSSPYMTLSCGFVNKIPQKDADYHDFFHKADLELYKNKTKKKTAEISHK